MSILGKIMVLVSVSGLLSACGGEQHLGLFDEKQNKTQSAETVQDIDQAALQQQAKAAIKALGGTLIAELQTAMKSGGPVAAIDVCQQRAPEVATQVSTESGMQVGRTSLKHRNPSNQAAAWQHTVLQDFEQRKAAGEAPDQLVFSAVVKNAAGQQEFRFMKAIPTGGVCLTCHGESLSPEVSKKLQATYPHDTATGFNLGDLRGAFVVSKLLD